MRYLLSSKIFDFIDGIIYWHMVFMLFYWFGVNVPYPLYCLYGMHGLSVIDMQCMLFTQLGGRLRLHTNLHSHFCFPWIVIQNIFSHSLEYFSKCPTSQKLGQHQLISPEVGEGCNITVCWNQTEKNYGQFTNQTLIMLYPLSGNVCSF